MVRRSVLGDEALNQRPKPIDGEWIREIIPFYGRTIQVIL